MIMSVGLNCGFEFEKGRQLFICMHNKASSVAALCGHNPNWSAFAMGACDAAREPSGLREIVSDENLAQCSFLTSYTPDRICHALPIVPFTFRNERVQRFENFLLTELGDELF